MRCIQHAIAGGQGGRRGAGSEHRRLDVGAEDVAKPLDDLPQGGPRLDQLEGHRQQVRGGLAGLALQAIEQRGDPGAVPAPPDLPHARDLAVLTGYRNLPRGDVAALAKAIAAFSTLAHEAFAVVSEAEINPLLVKRDGESVVAVDGLVLLKGAPSP